jgi:cytochrome c
MRTFPFHLVAGAVLLASVVPIPASAAGDPNKGAQVFGACAGCHSLEPGRHLTGPSLHDVLGRKAGTAPGFVRYSEALRNSGLVWNEKTLDAWLANPQALVPGNLMTFPGIREPRTRANLIAFLRSGDPGAASRGGGMMGMMGSPELFELRELGPSNIVTAIRYCGDAYFVTTAAGNTFPFWEFNLRFKTDSGPNGPARGKPVLIEAGMRGDRVFVVFSHPEEMSRFIVSKCP